MSKHKFFKISIVIVSIIMVSIFIYTYRENNKTNDFVFIGNPINKEQIQFNEPVNDKNDIRNIQVALMIAKSIESTEVVKTLPDAVIKMDDKEAGICYLFVCAWFDNDKIIFKMDGYDLSKGDNYKIIEGDYATEIIECITKYLNVNESKNK